MTVLPAEPRPRRRIGFREAARLLAARDPVIAQLVDAHGLPTLPVPRETHFATLVRSITYQQLAGAAARAIHGRLIAVLQDDVSPERVLATPPELLRGSGLSGNKVVSVVDLATKVLDGTVVLDSRRLARLGDQEIVARLSTVRGIGKWSAEMFLMFQLRRIDIWPTGDLAVRKGFAQAWDIPVPTAKALEVLGDPFRPYRSVVAWYCWRVPQLGLG
ncbi:DNA-3-methyladenine glycosylase [Jatrophihabitans sp. DSM 45814]